MDNSQKNIIKEIAENMDCGNDSYYDPKTDEIVTIPNFSHISEEKEFKAIFQADINKIEE